MWYVFFYAALTGVNWGFLREWVKMDSSIEWLTVMFMLLDFFLFLHIFLARGTVSRNGCFQWILYCWINAPKYTLFYFLVMPYEQTHLIKSIPETSQKVGEK